MLTGKATKKMIVEDDLAFGSRIWFVVLPSVIFGVWLGMSYGLQVVKLNLIVSQGQVYSAVLTATNVSHELRKDSNGSKSTAFLLLTFSSLQEFTVEVKIMIGSYCGLVALAFSGCILDFGIQHEIYSAVDVFK